MKNKVEVKKRNSVFVELKDWCVMSMGEERKDKGDFLEVTEWSNGEGYDICILDVNGENHLDFTYGQFSAIKKCIKAIHNEQI